MDSIMHYKIISYHKTANYCNGKLQLLICQMLSQQCICLFLQVHWCIRSTGHMRQHSRAGEQTEATLPKTPRPHAIHRRGSQRVDPRMPAPVPTPSLELQHAGARPHCVRPCHVAQSVFMLHVIIII